LIVQPVAVKVPVDPVENVAVGHKMLVKTGGAGVPVLTLANVPPAIEI
jgi:hypothetical protein